MSAISTDEDDVDGRSDRSSSLKSDGAASDDSAAAGPDPAMRLVQALCAAATADTAGVLGEADESKHDAALSPCKPRVLIVGDAQVGKTWLAHRFRAYAQEDACWCQLRSGDGGRRGGHVRHAAWCQAGSEEALARGVLEISAEALEQAGANAAAPGKSRGAAAATSWGGGPLCWWGGGRGVRTGCLPAASSGLSASLVHALGLLVGWTAPPPPHPAAAVHKAAAAGAAREEEGATAAAVSASAVGLHRQSQSRSGALSTGGGGDDETPASSDTSLGTPPDSPHGSLERLASVGGGAAVGERPAAAPPSDEGPQPARPVLVSRASTQSPQLSRRALRAVPLTPEHLADVCVCIIVADTLQPTAALARYADSYAVAVRNLVHAARRMRRRAARAAASTSTGPGHHPGLGTHLGAGAGRAGALHFVLVCNKTDVAPCSLLTAEAVTQTGLAFVAASARNQVNTRYLWRTIVRHLETAVTMAGAPAAVVGAPTATTTAHAGGNGAGTPLCQHAPAEDAGDAHGSASPQLSVLRS